MKHTKKSQHGLVTCSISLLRLLFWLSPGDSWGWGLTLEWWVWLFPRNTWPCHWGRAWAEGDPPSLPTTPLTFCNVQVQEDGLHFVSAFLSFANFTWVYRIWGSLVWLLDSRKSEKFFASCLQFRDEHEKRAAMGFSLPAAILYSFGPFSLFFLFTAFKMEYNLHILQGTVWGGLMNVYVCLVTGPIRIQNISVTLESSFVPSLGALFWFPAL